MERFKLENFKLEAGDIALFINNKGLVSENPVKGLMPLFVRCMENPKELALARFTLLSLNDSNVRARTFSVLGAYLSPWQEFPAADIYHYPTISLPNIEVISPSRVKPVEYKADRFAKGLWEIRHALKYEEDLDGYREYQDMIELQLPKNVRSGLVTEIFQLAL